jgi:hypothetical protein
VKKNAKVVETTKRGRPDFSGVPGELVDAAVVPAGLHFGTKLRGSPYDGLLKQLADAGAGKMLKFGDPKARVSINVRARKLGLKVSCAEDGNVLWVRFDGRADDDVKASRREKILGVLKFGPNTAIRLAHVLREKGDENVDASLVEAICVQVARSGEILRQEGGTWALNPRHKAAA